MSLQARDIEAMQPCHHEPMMSESLLLSVMHLRGRAIRLQHLGESWRKNVLTTRTLWTGMSPDLFHRNPKTMPLL